MRIDSGIDIQGRRGPLPRKPKTPQTPDAPRTPESPGMFSRAAKRNPDSHLEGGRSLGAKRTRPSPRRLRMERCNRICRERSGSNSLHGSYSSRHSSRPSDPTESERPTDANGLAMTTGIITSIPDDSLSNNTRNPVPVDYIPKQDQAAARREPLPHHLNKGGGDFHQYPSWEPARTKSSATSTVIRVQTHTLPLLALPILATPSTKQAFTPPSLLKRESPAFSLLTTRHEPRCRPTCKLRGSKIVCCAQDLHIPPMLDSPMSHNGVHSRSRDPTQPHLSIQRGSVHRNLQAM